MLWALVPRLHPHNERIDKEMRGTPCSTPSMLPETPLWLPCQKVAHGLLYAISSCASAPALSRGLGCVMFLAKPLVAPSVTRGQRALMCISALSLQVRTFSFCIFRNAVANLNIKATRSLHRARMCPKSYIIGLKKQDLL